MTSLTDKARANLASGATTGPGTGVCRKCHGPKERSRLNSGSCRTCGSGDRVAADRKLLRVHLPTAVWDALAAQAGGEGLPAYAARVLTERTTS